jgi:hypothetical protein
MPRLIIIIIIIIIMAIIIIIIIILIIIIMQSMRWHVSTLQVTMLIAPACSIITHTTIMSRKRTWLMLMRMLASGSCLCTALSFEVRQTLSRYRPATLGQATRLSGVTPAAVSLLLVHLKKKRFKGFGLDGPQAQPEPAATDTHRAA